MEGMSSWALTGLSILSLHLNRLSQAPLVPCMTALRRLVLDSNCISTLPDMVSSDLLFCIAPIEASTLFFKSGYPTRKPTPDLLCSAYLSVSLCKVSTLQSLENLFVANNLLTDVPASLSSLSSLVVRSRTLHCRRKMVAVRVQMPGEVAVTCI